MRCCRSSNDVRGDDLAVQDGVRRLHVAIDPGELGIRLRLVAAAAGDELHGLAVDVDERADAIQLRLEPPAVLVERLVAAGGEHRGPRRRG
jgi:hypothetical protein